MRASRLILRVLLLAAVGVELAGCGGGNSSGSAGEGNGGVASIIFSGSVNKTIHYGRQESNNSRMFCTQHNGSFEIEMTENYQTDGNDVNFDSRVQIVVPGSVPSGHVVLRSQNINIYVDHDSSGRPEQYTVPRTECSLDVTPGYAGDRIQGKFVCDMAVYSDLNKEVVANGSFSCPIQNQ